MTQKQVLGRPTATADLEQGKRNLDAYGYTIHEGLLSADEVSILLDRLDEQAELERKEGVASIRDRARGRVIGRPDAAVPPVWQAVTTLLNKGRPFIDLAQHPVVLEYGRHVLGGVPYQLVQSTGIIVRSGAGEQVVHNDQQAIPFLTPVPVYFTAMIALSDYDEDMGATRFVPGSHKSAAPEIRTDASVYGGSTNVERVVTVPAVCLPGDAVIFEGRVWHGQGAAISEKVRYSVLNGYAMHFVKPQEVFVASLHDQVYESLTEEERALFGFRVEYQYAGRIAPRFAGDTRRNTNIKYPYIPELRHGSDKHAVPFPGMGGEES